MAVHPVGSRLRREVVAARLAGFEHRHRHVGHAVLDVGRDLAVPVDDRLDVERVGQIDAETLTGVQDQPLAARAVHQAIDRGRAAIDIQRARRRAQRQRRGLRARDPGQRRRSRKRRGRGQKAASRDCVVHDRAPIGSARTGGNAHEQEMRAVGARAFRRSGALAVGAPAAAPGRQAGGAAPSRAARGPAPGLRAASAPWRGRARPRRPPRKPAPTATRHPARYLARCLRRPPAAQRASAPPSCVRDARHRARRQARRRRPSRRGPSARAAPARQSAQAARRQKSDQKAGGVRAAMSCARLS